MKILSTIISLVAFQYALLSQTTPTTINSPLTNEVKSKNTFFVSSSENEFTKAKFSPSDQNKNVVITNIPVSESVLNSIPIELEEMGVFTFKKDASLIVPINHEVFIEDKLTGRLFNLNVIQAFKFNVNQNNPNRFVMHILDKNNTAESVTLN